MECYAKKSQKTASTLPEFLLILRLLQDIATDVNEPISPDNPLRQVIVNTHSPAVVAQMPEDSLLIAETVQAQRGQQTFNKVAFSMPAEHVEVKSRCGYRTKKGSFCHICPPLTKRRKKPYPYGSPPTPAAQKGD